MGQGTEVQLAASIEAAEYHIAKLRRFTAGVDAEEMQWTPTGIANSLAWIVRHCADLLWLSYSRLTGERVAADLGGAGIAGSAVQGANFDETAPAPGPDAESLVAYLEQGWGTLKTYLQADAGWETVKLSVGREHQSGWAFVQHSVADLCYHTGQASYLRKLLAAERRRARARRPKR
jgi:hypothetical protein